MGCDWYEFETVLVCGIFFDISKISKSDSESESATFVFTAYRDFTFHFIKEGTTVRYCILTLKNSIVTLGRLNAPGPYEIETYHTSINDAKITPRFSCDAFQTEFARMNAFFGTDIKGVFGEFAISTDGSTNTFNSDNISKNVQDDEYGSTVELDIVGDLNI